METMSTTEDHKEGNVYELGYLLLPSLPEDKLSEVVTSIKKIITDAGAKTLDSEDPFMHDLAYSMSKTVGTSKYVVNEAYIGWMKFEAEPSIIPALNTEIEKMGEMLRFLLIKAPRETTFTFASARQAKLEKENERLKAERAEADDSVSIGDESMEGVEVAPTEE
jgi:ribosomal protein S6